MASGSHVRRLCRQKRGVTCPRGVGESGNASGSKAASPNVASKRGVTSYVASGSQVASPDVAPKRFFTVPRSAGAVPRFTPWLHMASQDVASECGFARSVSIREPPDAASKRGVRRRHRPTRRRRTWRQYAASGGPGLLASVLKTWSSGDMCTPTEIPCPFL